MGFWEFTIPLCTIMVVHNGFVHNNAMHNRVVRNNAVVTSRSRFSISPVQVRELILYTSLRLMPYIVIPVLGLSLWENYQG